MYTVNDDSLILKLSNVLCLDTNIVRINSRNKMYTFIFSSRLPYHVSGYIRYATFVDRTLVVCGVSFCFVMSLLCVTQYVYF